MDCALCKPETEHDVEYDAVGDEALGDKFLPPPAWPPRISIGPGGGFVRGSESVVPLGGNYVMKAQPYFPPKDRVSANAKKMAEDVKKMPYKPPTGATVVPVVRLGALFEGAMPEAATPTKAGVIDPSWWNKLDATIEAFAVEGVYVFLDAHQDALSTTNGGEGFPWWVATHMQETDPETPYLASDRHPLDCSLGDGRISKFIQAAIKHDLTVRTAGGPQPWSKYSAGNIGEHPPLNTNGEDVRFMNVGNESMRLNNSDDAWPSGILLLTKQVQNYAYRLYQSATSTSNNDREVIFESYVTFVKCLCGFWERHSNVIAVELMNEPPLGGIQTWVLAKGVALPVLTNVWKCRPMLFDFYKEILNKLDDALVKAPIAIEDLMGSAAGAASSSINNIFKKLSDPALGQLKAWAKKRQLIFSFHYYYPGIAFGVDTKEKMFEKARKVASEFGCKTLYFSEYADNTPQATAEHLATATEWGIAATTYWHFADTDYTKTKGWYKYPWAEHPKDVKLTYEVKGEEVNSSDVEKVNSSDWEKYAPTVADGEFWGADINGARGGMMDVLSLVVYNEK